MTLLCSIYDLGFRNVAQEYAFTVADYLSGKMGFVLAEKPYNVQKHQNNSHTEYDVFRLSRIKEMPKVSGEIMKPGADGPFSCSALQFTLSYNALYPEKGNSETIAGKTTARVVLRARRGRV